ncbi:MAG TPA: polysaccharide pyruvyl transferase family protein [Nitrospiria bacterium]
MKITILGWYGTETIGDRGTFAGTLSILFKNLKIDQIFLGSLFPFFTEKTIFEDHPFWANLIGSEPNIKIFNSKKSKELESHITQSDMVVIGGGPLMHIESMYMLAYAFKFAKRKGIKNIIFGSGVGPFFTKRHKELLTVLFQFSDRIILRDSTSLINAKDIFREMGKVFEEDKILVSLDPAIGPCLHFKKKKSEELPKLHSNEITASISLRNFPKEYLKENSDLDKIKNRLEEFYKKLNLSFGRVRFIPMHYFTIGGDDRKYLNKLYFEYPSENSYVQNVPLSLEETMDEFYSADICFGMRYHSIIFQTILNGKNFVIDYTEPKKGKTSNFVKDIEFPKERYVNIQEEDIPNSFLNLEQKPFVPDQQMIEEKLKIYDKTIFDLYKGN